MRVVNLVLAALVLLVQADLWLGRSSQPRVWMLRAELEQQDRANEAARVRNEQLQAEVGDLRAGLEMVEEKARGLGMIRPDEILVLYEKR
ncbi:MAG TPA: septum formation initiator family protein [Rubrivivax sp.]|nr:septum formation initiator family protein [Burkholderiales bacterium]HNT39917.1 septum formation initiator family protein [Rubrivivax sp.]